MDNQRETKRKKKRNRGRLGHNNNYFNSKLQRVHQYSILTCDPISRSDATNRILISLQRKPLDIGAGVVFSNNVLVQRMSEGYTVTRMLPVLLLSLYYNIPVYHMAKFLFLFFQASIYSTFLFHLPLAPGDSPLFIYITDCSFLFFLHVERVLKTSRKHVMKPHCLFSPTYNFFSFS